MLTPDEGSLQRDGTKETKEFMKLGKINQLINSAYLPAGGEEPVFDLSDVPPEIRERVKVALTAIIHTVREAAHSPSIDTVFGALSEVESSHPRIGELREYGRHYREVEALIREPVGMSAERAEELLSRVAEQELEQAYTRMLKRLDREADYLRELKDVGIAQALPKGLQNGKFGAHVDFIEPGSRKAKKMTEKGQGGYYSPMRDRARINAPCPDAREIWKELASTGSLPRAIGSLDHELVHDAQHRLLQQVGLTAFIAAKWGLYAAVANQVNLGVAFGVLLGSIPFELKLQKVLENDTILAEIHAFEAAAASPSYGDHRLDERHEIVFNVLLGYSGDPAKLHVAEKAYDSVHTLRLLGLNDTEIGRLVSMERFDEESGTFPKLEERIKLEREALGLHSEREFAVVLNAMHVRHELELIKSKHLARKIAAEELERAAHPAET